MSNLEQIFEREQLIEYRNKVVKEILQTEQTYVEQLQTLTDKYLDPLREVNIISSEDITKVFSVIELIRDVNKTLLKDIQERIENWSDTQCIGDVFLTLGHFLKMYSQYCANFYSATEALITLRTSNKLFRVFEDEHPLPLTNVESYLILPVQRIPRYFLLLEDFLLNTWEDHMDYANLEKAVQMIKDIADYVNGRMKTIEHMNRVYQTDLTLGGECKDLVQPHRIWIAEGELSRIRTSLISYAVPVRLYLFNDILVVAEKKITGYRYSFKVDLLETFVVADADEQKFKHSFKIVSVDISSMFSCKSEEDCNFWVQQINDTITKLLQTKGSDSRAEYQQSRASLAGSLRLEPGSSGKYKISKEHSSLDLERASSLSALNRSKIEPKIEKDDSASPKSNTNSTNVLPGVGFIPESLLPQEQHMNEFRDPKPIYEPDEQESPLESPEPQPEPPTEVELERKRPPSTSDLFKNKPLPTYSDNSPIQSPASSSVSQASQNSNTVPYSAASRSNTGAERTPLLPSSSTTTRTENSGCSCRLL